MKQIYKTIFLLFFATSAFLSNAQQHYTPENTGTNPLKSSYISDVLMDNSGNVWLCTAYGLAKYDGSIFTNYTTADGLAGYRASSVYEDTSNNLWFACSAGLSKYDGISFTNYTTADGLIYDRINSIFQDSNGDMWFGSSSDWQGNVGGVSKFDGTTWTNYSSTTSGLPHNEIHGITQEGTNMWFGTKVGLAKFDGTTWTSLTTMDGLIDDKINTVAVDNSNNLWVGTNVGVSKYDGSNFTNYTTATTGLLNDKVYDIFVNGTDIYFCTDDGMTVYDGTNWTVSSTTLPGAILSMDMDNSGNSWVAGKSGAAKYDGTNWTLFSTDDGGMVSAASYSIVIDDSGDMWTSGFAGVSRFDGTNWSVYNKNHGLNNDYYWSMLKDNSGNIWMQNTAGNDVVKYDGTTFTTIPLPGLFEECSYLDPNNGDVWFGSFGNGSNAMGAIKYDGTNWTVYNDPLISQGQVYSIASDASGTMYFATNYGVITFDGTVYSTFSVLPSSEYVTEIFRDSQNNLWFTGSNYYKYDGTNLITFTSANDGITHGFCQDIVEDASGRIYFGTGKSVDIYNGGTWSTIGAADGLPDVSVYSLGMGLNGVLWIGYSGNGGVYGYATPVGNDDIVKKLNTISVSPNPTTGKFQLRKLGKNVDVEVSNIQGQTIWKKYFADTNVVDVDLTAHANGVYFVTVKSNSGVHTMKLIKE